MCVILVDCLLHLLEDLINGCEISSALSIAHGRQTVGLDRVSLIIAAAYSRDWLVCWHIHARWDNLWELETLKLEESTSDGLVVDWIKLSTLDLTEELIEGIIPSLAGFVVVCGLGSRSIVGHWAVSWVVACLHFVSDIFRNQERVNLIHVISSVPLLLNGCRCVNLGAERILGSLGSTCLRGRRRRVGGTNLRGWMIVLVGTVLTIRIMGWHGWCIVTLRDLSGSEVGVVWAVVVTTLCQTSLGSSGRTVGLW